MHWNCVLLLSVPAVLLAFLLGGCCHCPPIQPPIPSAEYRECRHPRLIVVNDCLSGCAKDPEDLRTVCLRSCCGLINDIQDATMGEKKILRECKPECRENGQ